MSQEEMDQCWKKLAAKIEEEVLDKYKMDDSRRSAYRGRASLLERTRVRRSRMHRIRKWREDCWARMFALFKEYNLQRLKSMHENSTDEAAAKNEDHEGDVTKRIRSKGRVDADNRWGC